MRDGRTQRVDVCAHAAVRGHTRVEALTDAVRSVDTNSMSRARDSLRRLYNAVRMCTRHDDQQNDQGRQDSGCAVRGCKFRKTAKNQA